jgi:hypothetical protein
MGIDYAFVAFKQHRKALFAINTNYKGVFRVRIYFRCPKAD